MKTQALINAIQAIDLEQFGVRHLYNALNTQPLRDLGLRFVDRRNSWSGPFILPILSGTGAGHGVLNDFFEVQKAVFDSNSYNTDCSSNYVKAEMLARLKALEKEK